ncbi:MAG: hypothetical protein K0S65_1871 [Labilithrix sp.]|jgi:hypothetical protein|nr:hypothetical protein [Labilithrix sp.]
MDDRHELLHGSVTEGAIDRRWRRLTAEANRAWARGDEEQARLLYEDALAEAEAIFVEAELGPTVEACVAPLLYTITSHNLAELARRHGEYALSSELIASAFRRLIAIAESTSAPLLLRSSCIRNLELAVAELARDLEQRNLERAAAASIHRAQAATALVHGLFCGESLGA